MNVCTRGSRAILGWGVRFIAVWQLWSECRTRSPSQRLVRGARSGAFENSEFWMLLAQSEVFPGHRLLTRWIKFSPGYILITEDRFSRKGPQTSINFLGGMGLLNWFNFEITLNWYKWYKNIHDTSRLRTNWIGTVEPFQVFMNDYLWLPKMQIQNFPVFAWGRG